MINAIEPTPIAPIMSRKITRFGMHKVIPARQIMIRQREITCLSLRWFPILKKLYEDLKLGKMDSQFQLLLQLLMMMSGNKIVDLDLY